MGLLELGEPLLPRAPEVVEQVEALHLLRTDEHVHSRRWTPGAHLELRHAHLSPGERGVDAREIGDEETEKAEASRRLEEREHTRREVGWANEAEREQRRAAHLERALEAAHADGMEHRRV